ncbi:Zinc finger protein basonuclin-2 [Melipona quadrifasciata]|uniref:Zinc finger protein basonuclin-2 n=1 Tax=Melipona quadrifasciata TaxID=166423 RepID=A0A0M9A3M7_9HYME|nr:Zinc finger protein basonuclin-2 [Melipona quadrifasciata]
MPSLMRKSGWWGMQRDRPYIPARSIGSASRSVSVLVELSRRGRARCATVARDGGVCWCLTMVGASPVADGVGVTLARLSSGGDVVSSPRATGREDKSGGGRVKQTTPTTTVTTTTTTTTTTAAAAAAAASREGGGGGGGGSGGGDASSGGGGGGGTLVGGGSYGGDRNGGSGGGGGGGGGGSVGGGGDVAEKEERPPASESVEPTAAFDVASLVLYGSRALPIRLKILLDQLFNQLQHAQVTRLLAAFGWTYEDYTRGYILQNWNTKKLLYRKNKMSSTVSSFGSLKEDLGWCVQSTKPKVPIKLLGVRSDDTYSTRTQQIHNYPGDSQRRHPTEESQSELLPAIRMSLLLILNRYIHMPAYGCRKNKMSSTVSSFGSLKEDLGWCVQSTKPKVPIKLLGVRSDDTYSTRTQQM